MSISESNEFRFKEFSNLDNSPDSKYLMESMDVMLSLDSIQAIKQRAISIMNLKPGDAALEVGCGTGEDAELIAQLVGENGSVTAIDLSNKMINEAKRRSTQNNVQYIVADANQLSSLNKTFSACHADRLLVSHDNYKELFQKITQVIQPGGSVSFTDVDAMSIVMHPYTEVTRIILSQLYKSFVNPYMGRMLPELFVDNGLKNITVIPETSMIRSFTTLNKIFQFSRIAEEAVRGGLLIKEAISQWFDEMYEAENSGSFLYCLTLFTVGGDIPSS